jgi:hypothetical protein
MGGVGMEFSTVSLELGRGEAAIERAALERGPLCQIEREEIGLGDDDASAGSCGAPVAIVATVSLSWIANRLLGEWLQAKDRGVRIDLRRNPPAISRTVGVPTVR